MKLIFHIYLYITFFAFAGVSMKSYFYSQFISFPASVQVINIGCRDDFRTRMVIFMPPTE